MNAARQTLNLITLAKSNPEGAVVPGTGLEVAVIRAPERLDLAEDLWLLVLEGDLIIDLPHGDFRTLKVGECIHLEKGLTIRYQPLEDTAILRQYR